LIDRQAVDEQSKKTSDGYICAPLTTRLERERFAKFAQPIAVPTSFNDNYTYLKKKGSDKVFKIPTILLQARAPAFLSFVTKLQETKKPLIKDKSEQTPIIEMASITEGVLKLFVEWVCTNQVDEAKVITALNDVEIMKEKMAVLSGLYDLAHSTAFKIPSLIPIVELRMLPLLNFANFTIYLRTTCEKKSMILLQHPQMMEMMRSQFHSLVVEGFFYSYEKMLSIVATKLFDPNHTDTLRRADPKQVEDLVLAIHKRDDAKKKSFSGNPSAVIRLILKDAVNFNYALQNAN
jgi:hypothetical protein